MCREPRDDDSPSYCKVCAERLRSEQFDAKAAQVAVSDEAGCVFEALVEVTHPKPAFRGRVWTDRGVRRTTRDILSVPRDSRHCCRIGERFTLNAQADRPCYVTLLDVGTSGKIHLLLRNFWLPSGKPVSLTGPDEQLEWVVGGPTGIERIKAFFTVTPLAILSGSEPFSPLTSSGSTRDILTRIKEVGKSLNEMPPDSWTDATCQFTVEPA